MKNRLHTLRAKEVSVVPRGAINRPFTVLKEADAPDAEVKKAIEAVHATPPSVIEKIKKVLKSFAKKPDSNDGEAMVGDGLDREAQVALEAVGRILAPHKDQITDAHMDAVQEQVGIQGDSGGDGDDGQGGGDTDEEIDVKPADLKKAQDVAMKAYGEEMQKLGYQKYPEAELTMKGKKKFPSGEKDDDEEDDAEGDEEDDQVSKENTQVQKPILKEDGSINLDAVPAEMRPFAEVIAKQQAATATELKATKEQNVKLEKELADNKASNRKAEIGRIADGFKNLQKEHVTTVLELADGAGKEKFDAVLKGFEAQDKQAGESREIFKSIGSAQSRGPAGADGKYDLVTKAVEQIVQKSAEAGKPITKEQAEAQYLEQNPAAYTQYKEQRQALRPDGA